MEQMKDGSPELMIPEEDIIHSHLFALRINRLGETWGETNYYREETNNKPQRIHSQHGILNTFVVPGQVY